MTKTKNVKRTLFASAMCLILCFVMLLGTTYAWFTDTVTSAGNKIQSGTLVMDLELYDVENDKWNSIKESKTPIFNYEKWEPGRTEVQLLKVENEGNLALKWMAKFVSASELSILADVIDVYVLPYGVQADASNVTYPENRSLEGYTKVGTVAEFVNTIETTTVGELKAGESAYLGIGLKMQESAGNEYQNLDLGGKFDLKIMATQYTHENDSFDNQYDANVEKPTVHEIWNNDDLHKAFTEGGQGIIKDMNLTDVHEELAEDKSLALNTNNSTISGNGTDYVFVNYGDLEVTGDGTIVNNMKGSIENWGKLYVNNLNIDVKGDKYGFHVKAGEAELNDLVLNAERGGVNIQGGKVTINSGSYKFSGYYDNVNKKWINGQTVYAVGEGVEVVINGGDFRFTGGTGGNQRTLVAQNGAKIIVNGGTFGKGNSKAAATWLWEYGGDIIIYGGSFEFDPSACVAEGYQAVKGADGWWTVSQIAG